MDSMQKELQAAKLSALQNQIVPHYIVNSLETIRMKLLLDGQSESAELLRCLQTSLKTYGFFPWDTVTVSQELSFLEDTLNLYKFRYLGKLTWEFCISQQADNLQIPRFLLQPILENSLRHGLSADMESPHLQVAASLEEDFLCLSVTDNGTGFSGAENSHGIGLNNINQRLQLLYGDSCSMDIKTVPGSGTCVTLRLPGKGRGYI
ncbi:MAG: histidine kinase [Oscillospiraceae bacterium]|nr:histidine kinase [Oscillospiraceae bacterium]